MKLRTALIVFLTMTLNCLAAFTRAEHERAAVKKAETYFTYEHNKYSNGSVTVRVKIEVERCEPIEGWHGEYRTTGKAYMTYLNTSGVSMNNDTCRFEAVTKDEGEQLKVTSITPKT